MPQRTFYNLEATALFSYRPPLLGGNHNWYVSTGFGASGRIMGIIDFVLDRTSPHEVDLGLRIGPGLQFKRNETVADRNRRFYLFLEPFGRYAFRMERGHIVFAEIGAQQPYLRLGLWFTL